MLEPSFVAAGAEGLQHYLKIRFNLINRLWAVDWTIWLIGVIGADTGFNELVH